LSLPTRRVMLHCNKEGETRFMKWRPLPETAEPLASAHWVGREGGEDVAWIVELRRGDQAHKWQVTTPHGIASGLSPTLQAAQQSAEAVLRVYRRDAAAE
jgi:hypothetical protein